MKVLIPIISKPRIAYVICSRDGVFKDLFSMSLIGTVKCPKCNRSKTRVLLGRGFRIKCPCRKTMQLPASDGVNMERLFLKELRADKEKTGPTWGEKLFGAAATTPESSEGRPRPEWLYQDQCINPDESECKRVEDYDSWVDTQYLRLQLHGRQG